MIKLHDGGAYLVNGTEIIPDNTEAQAAVTAKNRKNSQQSRKLHSRRSHMVF